MISIVICSKCKKDIEVEMYKKQKFTFIDNKVVCDSCYNKNDAKIK